ncbi:diiron oxygenase [Zoogloeaceae bacterium G21618-S1]|nr:diiron oxygenase [Zoogloeaceae bacterium G21618-S1]
MESVLTPPIELSQRRSDTIARLITSSYEKYMDVNTVVAWNKGIDRKLLPKDPTQSWIYGTLWWDILTDEQRTEVLWLETARDASMFITLETSLPPLYVGYINRYGDALPRDVYEYMMIFSKEEINHTLAFRRYMKMAGLKMFRPADGIFELLVHKLPTMHPVSGMLVTVVLELVAELAAMHATKGDNIEPRTVEMFHQHHEEEARHIAFGRLIGDAYFETAPEADLAQMRGLLRNLMDRLIPQFTYNPEIAEHTSFAFPIARDDHAAIAAVRSSAANQALNAKRFAPLYSWLRKLGVCE